LEDQSIYSSIESSIYKKNLERKEYEEERKEKREESK
jgi:hypothetical protein